MRRRDAQATALRLFHGALWLAMSGPLSAGPGTRDGDPATASPAMDGPAHCEHLADRANAVCRSGVAGERFVVRATERVATHNTASNREEARLARADASYATSVAVCNGRQAGVRTACIARAKAELVAAWTARSIDSAAADAALEGDQAEP